MNTPCVADRVTPTQPALAGWPLHAVVDLGALPTAPGCARAWTREILWEWRLTGLSDTAALVVSELTTNSVLASRSLDHPAIRLILASDRHQLVIFVRDCDPGIPKPRNVGPEEESGRGLVLVESISDRFGWYRPHDGTPGKVMWAVLSHCPPDYPPHAMRLAHQTLERKDQHLAMTSRHPGHTAAAASRMSPGPELPLRELTAWFVAVPRRAAPGPRQSWSASDHDPAEET